MEQEINEERKNKLVEFIQSEHYTPMKLKELAAFFGVPKDERGQFDALVDVILREGKGVLTEKGKLMPPDNTMRVGIFLGTKKGFGFVRVEDEPDDDVFIPEHGCKDAFHGDKVMIRIWKKGKGNKAREGEIVKILERNTSIVVGTYQKSRNYGFVVADNEKFGKDIFIPKKKDMGAVNDHKVVVKITDFGSDEKKPEGEIVEILGHINDPGVDIISVIRGYGLPEEFPEEVMREVANKPDNVTEEEKATRKDLRDLQTVTIDGEDALDLDDAITLERSADGVYHLGVHIADVSYYVKEGTCLDKEAVNRGTSVYLVDRVIPMLPHRLSNGICSLNAHEDRLALSCLMDIDSTGKMIAHEICETLICVDERMNYTDVNDILTHHKEETCHRYEALVPMFEQMKDLAHIVRKKRKQQGSIDFDFPECKIKLDKEGHPTDIVPYDRNVATRLIEEFMLLANQTVAEEFYWMEAPFVYRNHEEPDLEKMRALAVLTRRFGYKMKLGSDTIHPREVQHLIEQIEGSDEEAFLSRITLRSMKRAKYEVENRGHFGLAAKYYCHFTSPIRRYPDLQIHRIIKEQLHGTLNEKRTEHYYSILPGVSNEASILERRADDAERDVDKMKKAEYMKDRVGQCYEGIISGVTSWGMYVELPNTVEGMIRLSDMMDDHYDYKEETYEIIGRKKGKVYRLGERIKVCVSHVDLIAHNIDFTVEMR